MSFTLEFVHFHNNSALFFLSLSPRCTWNCCFSLPSLPPSFHLGISLIFLFLMPGLFWRASLLKRNLCVVLGFMWFRESRINMFCFVFVDASVARMYRVIIIRLRLKSMNRAPLNCCCLRDVIDPGISCLLCQWAFLCFILSSLLSTRKVII